MYDILQALSIGLTLPMLFFCGLVLKHYHGTFDHVYTLKWGKARPRDWIAAGIYIGALGEMLDGSYWLIAWTANFYELPIASSMIRWGVTANIPFREVMGFMWAYGHVRADYEQQPHLSVKALNTAAVTALGAGFIGAFFMFMTRLPAP